MVVPLDAPAVHERVKADSPVLVFAVSGPKVVFPTCKAEWSELGQSETKDVSEIQLTTVNEPVDRGRVTVPS